MCNFIEIFIRKKFCVYVLYNKISKFIISWNWAVTQTSGSDYLHTFSQNLPITYSQPPVVVNVRNNININVVISSNTRTQVDYTWIGKTSDGSQQGLVFGNIAVGY